MELLMSVLVKSFFSAFYHSSSILILTLTAPTCWPCPLDKIGQASTNPTLVTRTGTLVDRSTGDTHFGIISLGVSPR